MKNKIMPALIAVVVSMFMIINQNTIVKAWNVVSNYAAGFIAVPSDGSQGFNQNNLVWLDSSGKLPNSILPANAAGGWWGVFYSCGPCPASTTEVGTIGSEDISAYSDIPRVYQQWYIDIYGIYSQLNNQERTNTRVNKCFKNEWKYTYRYWRLCR